MQNLVAVWRGIREFFEDGDKALSMTRLLNFLAFWPSSYVLIEHFSENVFWAYLGTFAGTYVIGKGIDAWQDRPVRPIVNKAAPGSQVAGTIINPPTE